MPMGQTEIGLPSRIRRMDGRRTSAPCPLTLATIPTTVTIRIECNRRISEHDRCVGRSDWNRSGKDVLCDERTTEHFLDSFTAR
jgi:hypothetical protein